MHCSNLVRRVLVSVAPILHGNRILTQARVGVGTIRPIWSQVDTTQPTIAFFNSSNCCELRVEFWVADNIVSALTNTSEKVPSNDTLINPANPSFSGTCCPYFPIGGPVPVPEKSFTSNWGGMSAGPGMKYPVQCVDGLVHQHGGKLMSKLLSEAKVIFKLPDGEEVPGQALLTKATGTLQSIHRFQHIIHAAVPLRNVRYQSNAEGLLVSSYRSSLRIAVEHREIQCITCPLLGSGTAGFSYEQSAKALIEALLSMSQSLPYTAPFTTEQLSTSLARPGGPKADTVTRKTLRIVAQKLKTVELILIPLFSQYANTLAASR